MNTFNKDMDGPGGCPFMGGRTAAQTATELNWWPNRLDLSVLHQNGADRNPMGEGFDYAEAFSKLDLDAVIGDLEALMTDSQDWWPADYGHYGPFFIRMAWHSAGTYRVSDGRGGARSGSQRFAPLNSWPDNVSLDKARALLWPVKQKYGKAISWADLMILAGNIAIQSMGLPQFGFGGGRADVWESEKDIYWGPETDWLGDERYSGDRELANPLGAVQMGLIYVNPEGPNGNPDPKASARDIRETFGRMAMNDEETVALAAGGHTFGKAHGAGDPGQYVSAEPEGAPLEQMGLGWKNSMGEGHGVSTISSGIEGAWTPNPTKWDNGYFDMLLGHEWELTKSPAGAQQWKPVGNTGDGLVPDAHDPNVRHAPMMTTADMAMREDPAYREISERFWKNPDQFADAFARAWFKLCHRDMGPKANYLGKYVPDEDLIWQDPIPAVDHELVSASDIADLKGKLLNCGLGTADLVRTAWASASTFRQSDNRGGANGARLRLAPQKDWEANNPAGLGKALAAIEKVQADFNGAAGGNKKVSLADLIVLGGCAAIESAAKAGGHDIKVPFTAGRTDASQAQTDSESFEPMEPVADGFRNYVAKEAVGRVGELLIDRAQLLSLTVPEMTALVGGLRVLDANADGSKDGVLTSRPGTLSNDYFVNLLDRGTEWKKTGDNAFEGKCRKTGAPKGTATGVDLVFGSNSELRAVCEAYGSSDSEAAFVQAFVDAWDKVMMLDRFELA